MTTFKSAHQSNSKWVDPSFGADWSSMYWGQMGVSDVGSVKNMQSKIKAFKRPNEIYDAKPELYGSLGHPAPTGIQQGQIGDCWFLASLAALSEKPHRISQLIENKHYSDAGIFRFKFYTQGKWQYINVDDQLPVMKWGSGWHTFATSRSKLGAWWVPLFEKAFAKYNQNYERIEGGLGYEGLKVLSGLPVKYYRFDNIDMATAWTRFSDYSNSDFPMTTPCCRANHNYGIISGHAYTFLGTVQLSNGQKLAHVRNPWAVEKYNGPWSDGSKEWTPQFMKEANHKFADDGKYFLPFDIYFKSFYYLSVAYDHHYGQITPFQNINMNVKQMVFQVTVPKTQEVYITLEGANPRNYPRHTDCFKNPYINTYLMKANSNTPMFGIGVLMNSLYHNTQGGYKHKLAPGTYTYLVMNWGWDKGHRQIDLGLQVHAVEGGVSIKRVK